MIGVTKADRMSSRGVHRNASCAYQAISQQERSVQPRRKRSVRDRASPLRVAATQANKPH